MYDEERYDRDAQMAGQDVILIPRDNWGNGMIEVKNESMTIDGPRFSPRRTEFKIGATVYVASSIFQQEGAWELLTTDRQIPTRIGEQGIVTARRGDLYFITFPGEDHPIGYYHNELDHADV